VMESNVSVNPFDFLPVVSTGRPSASLVCPVGPDQNGTKIPQALGPSWLASAHLSPSGVGSVGMVRNPFDDLM
jgi:hypothetical protein